MILAAKRIGETGRAIGIDMTEEMLEKARKNAQKSGFKNVEFRLGDIENIPVEDNSADCIISNCVINLAENKQKVFNEAYRILKPGGRIMVSDMVLIANLPKKILESQEMYSGCISGALKKDDYINKIGKAGFENITIIREDAVRISDYIGSDKVISELAGDLPEKEIQAIDNSVVSIKISAKKL